jgi:hypothetical protein
MGHGDHGFVEDVSFLPSFAIENGHRNSEFSNKKW